MTPDTTIHQRPAEILQHLIRFDTTNPPGNEKICVDYAAGLMDSYGIKYQILGKDPNRTNLVARLPGAGKASPLLLYGHVDVVTTKNQDWQYDPFGGEIIDGYIWGRGALDMKSGVAMMIAAFLQLKADNITPPGDVILAVLSDEEAGGDYGAKFLVEEHPDLFEGVKYAFGEFGGFNLKVAGTKFYPIQIAEKQICSLEITFSGPGGHASMIHRDGAMAKLGETLTLLNKSLLPPHITPSAKMMYAGMAEHLKFPLNLIVRLLLKPSCTDLVLKVMGSQGKLFSPMLRNTVNPTIIQGGHKINVIPGEIKLQCDGRMLPGFKPDDFVREVQELIGKEHRIKVTDYDPGPSEPNMDLFDTLASVMKELDPEGEPVPLILSGVTDARFFSQIGIQTYGFTPLQLPEEMAFAETIHAADERIPVGAVEFGTGAILKALQIFHD